MNGHSFSEIPHEDLPLTDELDHEILMHREAHFGGDFGVMLKYYSGEHRGINLDFEIDRIEYLAHLEQELGQDLAPLILTGQEAERVSIARTAYRRFKDLYSLEGEKNTFPRLIADLILSEEEEPEEEIAAIVAHGTRIVPELLAVIRSDEVYDPLFPGYGYAPYLAILCLAKIQDPETIIPLFETLGKESLFGEEVVLEALRAIGKPAKDFLLKLIKSRPLTRDNVNAAFALSAFPSEESVALVCYEELRDPEVRSKPLLATYLLCNCEALQHTSQREAFLSMATDPSINKEIRKEIEKLALEWQ